MIFINLENIERELLGFALAKDDFENLWMEKGLIENRMTISEFIASINLSKTMLYIARNNKYVPFNYMVTKDKEYLFYCGEINLADKEYIANHKYLDNLKKVDINKLMLENKYKPDGDYFVIMNNEFYQ